MPTKKDEPLPDDARPPPDKEPEQLPGKKKYIPPYTPKSALDRARAAAAETARAKADAAARAAKASSLQIIPKPRTSNGRQTNHRTSQVHHAATARSIGGGGGGMATGQGKKRGRGDISDDELADLQSKCTHFLLSTHVMVN